MPFDTLSDDSFQRRFGRDIRGAEPQWRDPAAQAAEGQLQVDPSHQILNTLNWLGQSMLMGTGAAAGANRAPAPQQSGARRPAKPDPTGLTRGFNTIADVAARNLVEQAQAGDQGARDTLLERMLPMLRGSAARAGLKPNPKIETRNAEPSDRFVPKVAQEDVMNELVPQVDNAIKTYNPREDAAPFVGYAKNVGRQSFQEAKDLGSVVPQQKTDPLIRQIREMEREWATKYGASEQIDPKTGEKVQLSAKMPDRTLARRMGLPLDTVIELRNRPREREAMDFSTLERMKQDSELTPLERIERKQAGATNKDLYEEGLANMDPRHREVFLKHRDPDNPMTQSQIAEEMGISQPAVFKIIQKAEKYIQGVMKGEGFAGKMKGKGKTPPPIGGGSDLESQFTGKNREIFGKLGAYQSKAEGGSNRPGVTPDEGRLSMDPYTGEPATSSRAFLKIWGDENPLPDRNSNRPENMPIAEMGVGLDGKHYVQEFRSDKGQRGAKELGELQADKVARSIQRNGAPAPIDQAKLLNRFLNDSLFGASQYEVDWDAFRRPSGGSIGGGSDAPTDRDWGSKPTRIRPLTSRELGTNPRATEDDPTAPIEGMSSRFQGNNPRTWADLKNRTAAFELRAQQAKREAEQADSVTRKPRGPGADGASYQTPLSDFQRDQLKRGAEKDATVSGGSQPDNNEMRFDRQATSESRQPLREMFMRNSIESDTNHPGFGSQGIPWNNDNMFRRFLDMLRLNRGG